MTLFVYETRGNIIMFHDQGWTNWGVETFAGPSDSPIGEHECRSYIRSARSNTAFQESLNHHPIGLRSIRKGMIGRKDR